MRWKAYQLKDGSNARETIASDAGYCITRTRRVCVGAVAEAPEFRYLAWHGRSGDAHFRMLGHYPTSEEAKAAREAHAAKNREIAA